MGSLRLPRKADLTGKLAPRRVLRFEALENRRLLSASGGANVVPKAVRDEAVTHGNVSVVIDVIQNDYDQDGTIDAASVQVAAPPRAGSVDVRADGTVKYTPPPSRFGIDSFSYTVKDNDGASSQAAIVMVTVRSVWQNADNPLDVNDDGGFSPIDILRVVNELNRGGSRLLNHPPSPPVTPPPYVDVTGDGYLTPADAIFAINCLNRQMTDGSLASCPLEPPPVLTSTQSPSDPPTSYPGDPGDPVVDPSDSGDTTDPQDDTHSPPDLGQDQPPTPSPATNSPANAQYAQASFYRLMAQGDALADLSLDPLSDAVSDLLAAV